VLAELGELVWRRQLAAAAAMASEAANWMELNATFYEQRELYSLSWGVDLEASRVAVAPFGGPVAVTRDARKIVKSSVGQVRSVCAARVHA